MRRDIGRDGIGWAAMRAVSLPAVCLCILFAGLALQGAGRIRQNISILLENSPVTGAQVDAMRKAEQAREDGIDFVAWQEYKNKRVTNVDGTGAASANVLEFSGSSELLALERHLPREDVAKSCLIGERTAEELYGSRSARGNILCYEGREYTVQGVLREPGNLVVLQNDDENAGFVRLTIAPKEGRSLGRTAEQFLERHGLDGSQLRYDMLGLSYFVELAPGKWSDFAWVKQSILKMQDDIVCLLATEKSSIELLWFRDVGFAVTGFLVGFVLLWRQFPTKQIKK